MIEHLLTLTSSWGSLSLWLISRWGSRGWLSLGRSPEGEVVTQELHDEGRVLVALLAEGIKLCY